MTRFALSLFAAGFAGLTVLLFLALLAVPADDARADSGHPGGSLPPHQAAGADGGLAAGAHVNTANPLNPAAAIPSELRVVSRPVARGYTGSVAFFVAASVGVTLSTPAADPENFDLPNSQEFAHPAGFALDLTAVLDAGGDAAANFEVVASRADFDDFTIPLEVNVRVVSDPGQPERIAEDAFSDFSFDFVLPDGYGASAPGFAEAGFRIVGFLEEADGDYQISVGMTHPGFLGELILVVPVGQR